MRFLLVILLGICHLNTVAQPANEAYTLGVDGIKKVEANDFKEGIRLLKKARNLEPEQYDYTFEIGRAYFLSGDAKRAEKYLYPLQYHVNVQPDLYILLAKCYYELNELRKTPDEERKKELNALRYGIQKLPKAGVLYLELGKRKLKMEQPLEALVVFESGIVNAPNFAENYFWASKLLKATGNHLWTWIYAETFYNMTEDEEMQRTAALLIQDASGKVFSENWQAEPEQMDQELRDLIINKCKSEKTDWTKAMEIRECLLEEWVNTDFPLSVLIERMAVLRQKGFLEAYLASIYVEPNKEVFLPWLANRAKEFESYRKWRYWNPVSLNKAINRTNQ